MCVFVIHFYKTKLDISFTLLFVYTVHNRNNQSIDYKFNLTIPCSYDFKLHYLIMITKIFQHQQCSASTKPICTNI